MKLSDVFDPARVSVIAEIGVNHNGSLDKAKELLHSAVICGADAVKIQSFDPANLVDTKATLADYQAKNIGVSGFQRKMLEELALDRRSQVKFFDFARSMGVLAFSTPYSAEEVTFLLDSGVKVLKTASADLWDWYIHEEIAKSRAPVLVSTGMAGMADVSRTLQQYGSYSQSPELGLLHCVSNYPASLEAINISAVTQLAEFGFPVGLSDHSVSSVPVLMAIALGARLVEKHFTLDRSQKGPDHSSSFEPEEFRNYVGQIRAAESAFGGFEKTLQPEEKDMFSHGVKKIFVKSQIQREVEFSYSDFYLRRSSCGLAANLLGEVVGRKAKVSIESDTPLEEEMVIW